MVRSRVAIDDNGTIYAAELLGDGSVLIYRNGHYIDDGTFTDGRLGLFDEYLTDTIRTSLELKLAASGRAADDP